MRDDEKRPEVPDIGSREDDELSQYGDEQDVPVRRRRRSARPPRRQKGQEEKGIREKRRKKRAQKKRRSFFEWLFSGSPKRAPRRRGALRLFGREIHLSFWPVFLVGIALLLAIMVLLQGNSLTVDEQEVTMVGLPEDLEGYRILLLSDLNGRRFGDEQATILREIGTLDYDAVFIVGDMVGRAATRSPSTSCSKACPPAAPSTSSPAIPTRSRCWTPPATSPAPWSRWCWRTGSSAPSSAARPMWTRRWNWRSATPASGSRRRTCSTSTPRAGGYLRGADAAGAGGHGAGPAKRPRHAAFHHLPLRARAAALAGRQQHDRHRRTHLPGPRAALGRVPRRLRHARFHRGKVPHPALAGAGGALLRRRLAACRWLGAFYIPSSTADRHGWFPAQEDVQGLSTAGGTQMYITAGLSTTGSAPLMFFRFLNRPQISIIELTATLPQNMLEQ